MQISENENARRHTDIMERQDKMLDFQMREQRLLVDRLLRPVEPSLKFLHDYLIENPIETGRPPDEAVRILEENDLRVEHICEELNKILRLPVWEASEAIFDARLVKALSVARSDAADLLALLIKARPSAGSYAPHNRSIEGLSDREIMHKMFVVDQRNAEYEAAAMKMAWKYRQLADAVGALLSELRVLAATYQAQSYQ
ncbi:hypothetical protein [Agrobacterium sp.]|uniref:hypothetical protein n=1 Tax=Agrobacterium sp. TaxID=361 RepID=UPI0025C10F68|nr:hypothetical protein [Agrobacterium sp.]MCD4663120.1 hypothetical protein [Agrobacterium sp.]